MEARIFKENGDYVVYAEIISPDGYTTFKPLRNFGCRQSDAIEYRDSDLKDVTEPQLNMLFRDFKPIIIGLEPSKLDETKFYPILLPCWMRRTREAMSMYEIQYVHELQTLLDMWKVNVKIKP